MTEYILKLVAIENSVSSITAVETHSIKTMQFSLLIAVHTSGVAPKKSILARGDAKNENWRTI